MIIDFILIFFAAMCNAVMDTADHHFKTSIFSLLKKEKWRLWFNENKGWLNKYIDRDISKGRVKWEVLGFSFNKPVQLSDAWHFFKMLMIFLICMIPAVDVFYWDIVYFDAIGKFWNLMIHWTLLGTVWNLTFFRLFYNFLFLKKTWGK